jgi:hypothetical protein
VAKRKNWSRGQRREDGPAKAEVLRLARLYQERDESRIGVLARAGKMLRRRSGADAREDQNMKPRV